MTTMMPRGSTDHPLDASRAYMSRNRNVLNEDPQCDHATIVVVPTAPVAESPRLPHDDRGGHRTDKGGGGVQTRRPVGVIIGKATIFTTALGVGLTAAAATITPDRSQRVPARQPAAPVSATTTIGQPSATPPLDDASAGEIARLQGRIEQRLDRGNHTSFVTVTLDNELLAITWDVATPRRSAEGSTTQSSVDARRRQLRRELRHILRSLATTTLPPTVTKVRLHGHDPAPSATDPDEDVVLDAVFDAKTLSALHGDIRVGDATLEELLGLADRSTGDADWGVPIGEPLGGLHRDFSE
jgi:hypothetical protein